MQTRIIFQYLAPGSDRPDDITVSDVPVELAPGDQIPNIGDIVTMLPKPPSEELTNFRRLKVVARNFFYTYGGPHASEIMDCQIFLIVSEPDAGDITSIKE